jgi:hypothetical protein
MSADLRQPSAGVAAAGPEIATECTRPSEPNVTVAVEPESWPARQLRAPIITEPTAAWTSPTLGRFGVGSSEGAFGGALGGFAAGGSAAFESSVVPSAVSGSTTLLALALAFFDLEGGSVRAASAGVGTGVVRDGAADVAGTASAFELGAAVAGAASDAIGAATAALTDALDG